MLNNMAPGKGYLSCFVPDSIGEARVREYYVDYHITKVNPLIPAFLSITWRTDKASAVRIFPAYLQHEYITSYRRGVNTYHPQIEWGGTPSGRQM
jgi:23S rRNA maturation mini-RNase III